MTYVPVPPAAPPADAAPPRKRRTGLIIGLVAGGLVLLLVLGGVGFLLFRALLGSDQSATASAKALPASTISWAEYSIDPSNGQKLAALSFIDDFDGLREIIEDSDVDIDLDEPNNTDLKKALWEAIVENDDADLDVSLDYDDDVRPWLGSRIAMGVLPSDDADAPQYIVAVEASDTTKGIEAVETLVDDLDIDAEVGSRDGYVLVASEDVDLDDVFDDGTLAESTAFQQAASSAGEWGLASYWVDLGQVAELALDAASASSGGDTTDPAYWEEEIRSSPESYVPYPDYEYVEEVCADPNDYYCGDYYYSYEGAYYEDFDEYADAYLDANLDDLVDERVAAAESQAKAQQDVLDQLDGTSTFGVLRFVDGALELSGGVAGVKDLQQVEADGSTVAGLPDSTLAAISASGIAEAIDSAITDENLALGTSLGSAYSGAPTSVTRDDVIDWADENLGLDLPDDLEVLFGRQVTIVVDQDVETDFESIEGADEVIGSGLAVVITSGDADATADAWQDLADRAEEQTGEPLGIDIESDGDRVVISAGSYLDTVLEPDDRLEGSDVFRRALPAAKDASTLFYLDIAAAVAIAEDLGADDSFTGSLDGLQAIGFSSTVTSDDSVSFVLRLTTEGE